jgi:short-subunit dehydrogenase
MEDCIHRGKVVVITGASSGFGKGVARKFAGAGASLVLAARRMNLLEEVARECEALGARAFPIETDVSNKNAVENVTNESVSRLGGIDIWINNAGVGAYGRFHEIPLEDHVKVVTTDLLGTLFGSYFAMRHFNSRGRGTLINVASEVGKVPLAFLASYSAAKHGVVGLTAAIRQELREGPAKEASKGIHLCTVMPSAMDTPFFEHASNHTGHQTVPPEPLYDPQDVVDAIFDLATNPRDEVVVGAAGKRAVFLHGIVPGRVEEMAAKSNFKAVFEDPPAAAPTRGNLAHPMESGTEVSGGWRNPAEDDV